MEITTESVDKNALSVCVKFKNGEKELSLSFRRINENQTNFFLNSVGQFETGKKDIFHNNVFGIDCTDSFFEWLNK